MKMLLTLLFVYAYATAIQAQFNFGMNVALTRSAMGFPSSQFFQTVVLESEAQKLLTTPDFPEELQQRVLDTMSNAEVGFENCNTATTVMPWMQIRCVVMQLSKSKNELKAIDDEAKARSEAAVNSLPMEPTYSVASADSAAVVAV